MSEKKSYFDPVRLSKKIKKSADDPRCPAWLPKALLIMGKNAKSFPLEEDKARYTIEYIYPH
jgi:hypothetical protein